jgi:Protein of unknown function (DUF1573)
MNKILAGLCIILIFYSCDIRNTRNKADALVSNNSTQFTDSTTVQLIDSAYNFGEVTDGDKVEYSYRFRNTGKNPLIVSNAVASCGCTVPEKPEEPIKPGETGFLKVVFNSKGRVGEVHKTITVTSNAYPKFPELELTGHVVAAER